MGEASLENTRSYVVAPKDYDFRAIVLNVGGVKGFQAAVVVDMHGTVEAENNRGGVDLDALTSTLFNVCKLVNTDTKELGIGRFHTGELDGPWGHIYVNILGDKILLTQCDSTGRGEDVLTRLERIIDSCSKDAS